MATASELLMQSEIDNKILEVDSDLRTIKIPPTITNLGVESDEDVLLVPFRMPSSYCGIDLSAFKIRINYTNGNNEPDFYEVTDATKQSDGTITFSWLIGRHAAASRGAVRFSICLRDLGPNSEILKEFNTTPASLPILEGLETEKAIVEDHFDFLEQWKNNLPVGSGGVGLPSVTSQDNGKFLRVVNGAWAVVTIPVAEEASV